MKMHLADGAETLQKVLGAITQTGARVEDLKPGESGRKDLNYDIRVFTTGDDQMAAARGAAAAVEGAEVLAVLDMAMEVHRGGSCQVHSRIPIKSNTDLRIVYTPGVARVAQAIQADPAKAREFTSIANKVAIATNGTAVLGLGDIGVLAGLPVMEGKAAIFAEFAGLSAEPVLIDTRDADEFITVMEKIACGFGAIQIEDVKAPECFKVTRELDKRLEIPVLHDDQHGTATIVLAGLYSALARTGRKIGDLRCAIGGAGAAGTAVADLLLEAGLGDVVLCDSRGIICRGRTDRMNQAKTALAERTNKENLSGCLADAMKGRDLFIGVSRPNVVSREMVRSMADRPIVLALANPVSEISKADAQAAGAEIYLDGRMMNNALAYPGLFRGALDAAAKRFTTEMLMAAAKTLAEIVPEGELMPEMMDPATHKAVAEAVTAAV